MAFRALGVAVLLSSLSAVGCGTVVNLARSRPEEGGKTPFGGVQQDLWCIRTGTNQEPGFRKQPESGPEQCQQAAQTLLCAADLPLSFVGDVLTWPYTAAYTYINSPVPTPPVQQAPKPPPPQVMADNQSLAPPLEALPEPRKLPDKELPK